MLTNVHSDFHCPSSFQLLNYWEAVKLKQFIILVYIYMTCNLTPAFKCCRLSHLLNAFHCASLLWSHSKQGTEKADESTVSFAGIWL